MEYQNITNNAKMLVKDNNKYLVMDALNILLKLFENIIKDPNEVKYRNFKISNETLKNKVLNLNHSLSYLESIGYRKKDDEFYIFDNQNTSNIIIAIDVSKYILDNYDEFLNEENPNAFKITLLVYDISNGMARQFSPMFLGKVIEGVWHTSLIVYGREFYFGGGICEGDPRKTPYGKPMKEIHFGETEISLEIFKEYLNELNNRFNVNTYHILNNNCNHFTNEIAFFLSGKTIPDNILKQHMELYNSPMGKMILPMLEKMNDQNSQAFPNMFENK